MEDKIDPLLLQLTLEEKIALLAGADLWHTHAIERLGIPALKMTDGPNGVRGENRDTHPVTSASFPIGTAMGATWNPELVQEVGRALAQEVRSKQAHVLLGPTINIHRTPLAGRNFECFSEDPYLTARLACAYIRGVQSEGVAACVKHFVCNDQEYDRFTISAEVPDRALHEIYLPPFKAAVQEAGVWSLMSAYNRVNGIYASENRYLLLDVLKDEWGFDGLVVSDWYGTYSDNAAAGGCDLEMPGPARWMGENVLSAVKDGSLNEKVLDDKVSRLLRTLFRTNAFAVENNEERSEDRPEHRELIRRVGTEAIVLLKNEAGILPIESDRSGKIAIIGQLASEVSFQGGGSSAVAPHYVVSPLEALKSIYDGDVLYAQGYDIHKQPPPLDADWLSGNEAEVQYFANIDLEGTPARRAAAPRTELSWFGEFDNDWDLNHFSLCMQGSFTPPATGEYIFEFSLIGRGRVYVDGELKIDLWNFPSSERQGELLLELDSEHQYTFKIEYVSDMDLRWRNVRLGAKPNQIKDLLQEAVALASSTDVAIVIAGLTPEWETEGFDRPDMNLPGNQDAVIQRVAAVNPNTVVVLNTGSAVQMPWLDAIQALLQMWYLGQESGHALADVLLGKANPSGKLPTTFPRRLEDHPAYLNYPGENGMVGYGEDIFVGYRYYDYKNIEPNFPFGHGLSYTSFEYCDLQFSSYEVYSGDLLRVSFQLINTGTCLGTEVVQLYIGDDRTTLVRPAKELKAFRKISLKAGEAVQIFFELSKNDLTCFDDSKNDWSVESGVFTVFIGSSSRDIRLSGKFLWKE